MWQPAAYERESSRARSVIQAGAGNFFVCLLSRSVTASSKAGAVGVDEGRLQRRNLDSLTQRHRSEGASILRTEKTKKKKKAIQRTKGSLRGHSGIWNKGGHGRIKQRS